MGRSIADKAAEFTLSMKHPERWEFRMSEIGQPTGYSSCFAAMIFSYSDEYQNYFSASEKIEWAHFIQGMQEQESGYFRTPEVEQGELLSPLHNREHLRMHFGVHAIPALAQLGHTPNYPLHFAQKFLSKDELQTWLFNRQWRYAWIEGNNLLFVGQYLIHLAEVEGQIEASQRLEEMFDWLDARVDPSTGLWGTNGFCSKYEALYGAYHQLLLYYYCNRHLPYHKALIDTVLSLQHFDGGFAEYRGGGTCPDVDAVDVLVNLYKRYDYRRKEIRSALRRAFNRVSKRQMASGGFISRKGCAFDHMGMKATYSPAGCPELFSTWFALHTLMLIAEVLPEYRSRVVGPGSDTKFNKVLSMGWHDKHTLALPKAKISGLERFVDQLEIQIREIVVQAYERLKPFQQDTPVEYASGPHQDA